MAELLDSLLKEMIFYNGGDPKRIHHFIKVHGLARLIGREEGLPEETQFILETAALVHDIGIKAAEEKYGSSQGKLQEQEGPPIAQAMLERLNFPQAVISRVCWLVGRHHTYSEIDGLDYQILVEADFLVNLYEDEMTGKQIQEAYTRIFKTEAGKKLCRAIYAL